MSTREVRAVAPVEGATVPRIVAAPGPDLSKSHRMMLAAAALALVVTLALPLWRISLVAPQYPEGLGMNIWASKITGDLRSINGLNHYIGMKEIRPEAIAELRLMPVVVVVLGMLGLGAAGWGRAKGLYVWCALLVGAAMVGLVDFWRWGFDYGHNLDSTAAIQVPGMSYQPPLIGSKQLLNFRALSLPAAGGWVAIAAVCLTVALVAVQVRRARALRAGV